MIDAATSTSSVLRDTTIDAQHQAWRDALQHVPSAHRREAAWH